MGVVLAGLVILIGAAGTVARGESELAAGSLDLKVTFRMVSNLVPCPPDAPPGALECRARTATGFARGLGNVTEIYGWSFGLGPPTCPAALHKPFATTGRLVVAGKGEITFALAEGTRCFGDAFVQNEPQKLTITGGTGPYVGASGRGTVAERSLLDGVGTETWTGTLEVPGLEFDTTPPTLTGATNKTVRAKKGAKTARVVFQVTAQDDRDGAVPVGCTPRPGSRFRIGRTRVTCEATDGSANTAAASFTVTVRARK